MKLFTVSIFAITMFSFTSCCQITPPPTRLYSNTELSGKVAADLEQAQAKGELSGSWKATSDKQFSTLNDDNAAYFMLLQAIRCESKRNKELARQMFQTLDREMSERRKTQPKTGRSSKTNRQLPAAVEAERVKTIEALR